MIDPATEQPIARIALGGAKDVDRAVQAARRAFESFSRTTRAERVALLQATFGFEEFLETKALLGYGA